MVPTCNIEKLYGNYELIECGKPAIWKHPRWPTGTYCEEHKQTLESFFPNDWTKIESDMTDVQC